MRFTRSIRLATLAAVAAVSTSCGGASDVALPDAPTARSKPATAPVPSAPPGSDRRVDDGPASGTAILKAFGIVEATRGSAEELLPARADGSLLLRSEWCGTRFIGEKHAPAPPPSIAELREWSAFRSWSVWRVTVDETPQRVPKSRRIGTGDVVVCPWAVAPDATDLGAVLAAILEDRKAVDVYAVRAAGDAARPVEVLRLASREERRGGPYVARVY